MIGGMGSAGSVRDARVLAWWLLGGAAVLAPLLAFTAVGWLRDALRFGCWFGAMGDEPGEWMCGDGLMLLMPGVGMLVLCGVALLIAGIGVRAATSARWLLPVSGLAAALPAVVTCLLLLPLAQSTDESIASSGGVLPPESSVGLWTTYAAVPMVLAALGALSTAVACALLLRGHSTAVVTGLAYAGPALLLVSSVPSLGGTLALAVGGAAIALAVGRVASATGQAVAVVPDGR
ncbi:hypothetical protein [Agrococcus beijingensis]|uniref:hypothetical protein n=1 Tax=Agrococcus beijingensis TaxID=3068634 RepID=UPI002741C7F1|nr:hypothetical protein [Agrococcus sp. REN33]